MILARPVPIPNDPDRFLIQRDREIPMDLVPELKRLGILEVWVRHRDLEFLEDLIDEGLGECQREVYTHVRRNFESIMRNTSVELDLAHFESSIGEMFDFLKSGSGSEILLQKLDAFDNYLMSHSTNIAYLAMLVGMNLDRYLIDERRQETARDAKNLYLLGMGCLLHDVGKMRISPAILHKPGRLTDEEMAEMRRHPIYGYEMVKGSLPDSAAQIVLNHHQRYDGSGYPAPVDSHTGEELSPPAGDQIPIFSRIAIMADVYDAATTRRCYSEAKLPVEVLHEMRVSCEGFFDPVVESAFYRTVPPFPIGQIVMLNNGIEAVVVDFNPDYPAHPKVQCLRTARGERFDDPTFEEIDLGLYPEMWIAEVDGRDVEPFLASQETSEPVAAIC